ncbi:Vacuolar protein sorting-associated protein [Parasponia andersonii]|uniref:Vacuolar protein sorting-associated protein n=1 Tax=Parasponia andersonii TaxID=3476 RepID=A0A2P5BZ50_PARAD|nr:Vacuolar protein sorting-associated protein [Parasponia andersonii]
MFFFNNITRRRLSSLLQSWFLEDPELDLKLGLINSHATAKNLRFDTSVLNDLIDEDSTGFCFEDATIEHLSLRFSNWSVPAFSFEVHGFHVTLSVGELKEGRSSGRVRRRRDTFAEELKKKLSQIDREGSYLHNILERISTTTPSRSNFKTAFLNLILEHCQLRMHDINVQVQFPMLSDSYMCRLHLKELNVESQYLNFGCLFRGLVGALYLPVKESSYVISASGFEIVFKVVDQLNRVLSVTDIFTSIKLNDFQLIDFNVQVPELLFSFSPLDLSMCLAFGQKSSKESQSARNGRQLWKLAASRVGHVTSTPRLTFHNLVVIVRLWLRYVSAYEYLLQLIGYSTDNLLKKSTTKIYQNKECLSSVRQHWKVITDIERELPVESIAQARKIARYRAAASAQSVNFKEPYVDAHVRLFWKIFSLLRLMWKFIFKVFHFIVCLFFCRRKLAKELTNEYLEIVSDSPSPRFCFILNLGRILVNISQLSATEKLESHTGILLSDFIALSLSIDAMLLKYVEVICEESLTVSCGQFKVNSASLMKTPLRQGSSKNFPRAKGHWKENNTDMKSILWCEPAQTFPFSETSNTTAADNAEGACDPFLEKFLGEMWLNWEKTCMKFDENEIEYSENPCLLCEAKSFLIYPGLLNSDSGFSKCFFTLGKLHLDLGCSSILSILVLLRQMQHVLCRTEDNGRSMIHLHSPRTIENPPEISCDSRYKFYSNSLSVKLLKMLPEKHIQLGIFIAGPCIKFFLEKEFSSGNKDTSHVANHDDLHISFEVNNIEVAIWPTSTPDSSSNVGHDDCGNAESECTRLKWHQIIDIPKSYNEKFITDRWILLDFYLRVNGLNAYLGDSTEKQKSQIFILQPMTLQFSSSREYFHSFSTNIIAFSAALCVTATGLTVLSYMDELFVLSQVVVNLYSAVSYVFSNFDFVDSLPSEIIKENFLVTKYANEEAVGEEKPSICSSNFFLVEGILKIKCVDVILQKTRINDDMESSIKSFDALSSKIFTDLNLPYPDCGILISIQQTSVDLSCEKERLEILTDFAEVQSVIFGYQNQKGKNTDQFVFRDRLLQYRDCLYEISVSNCKFSLSMFLSQSASSSRTMHNKLPGSTSGSNRVHMDNFSFSVDSERSSSQSPNYVQKLGFASNIPASDPSHWLFVDVVLGIAYVGSCSLKNALFGAHELNKLISSLSVGGEFQTISWGIQGGSLFLETTAMEAFISCFSAYFCSITNIIFGGHSVCKGIEKTPCNVDMTILNDDCVHEYVQGTFHTPLQAKGKDVQGLTVNVSQLSAVIVVEDEKGGVQELVLEFDVHLNFEWTDMERKLLFDLKRLSILSQVVRQSSGDEFQIPHFYSDNSNSLSTRFESVDFSSELQHRDVVHPLNDPSCSRDSDSPEELSAKNCVPVVSNLSSQKYILKHLGAFFSVQKPVNGPLCLHQSWVGGGSISGFDIILSLSEIKMILIIVSSVSGVFSKTTTSDLNKKQRSSNQEESNSNVEAMVPDGSIVAIQDVHQHMYFAVDGEENKYSLVGSTHYSLVGERALFRVKYHYQRGWRSSILWFSLLSLHAKNDSGEPFRLNYRPGSGFVDISSTDNGGCMLWRILSREPENYESDIDWEPYNQLVKRTFYLVNKKNDCAVAFVDGVPEFVRKPGNPFKFKVFHDLSVAYDVGKIDSRSLEDSRTSLQDQASKLNERTSGHNKKLPCIDIMFDKISLTIVHELSETSDMFPLLRASIDNTQLIVQVTYTKTRVISTLKAAIYHFDSQRNSWRELLHPVEIFLFYRSSFHIQGSEVNLHGVPVHIHCRTKELNISLSELSLDVLLFVVGKLNLAGPYLLKSSRILVNCCKVENQAGITLLCHFFNKQSLKVARNQSTSILLRYSDLVNQSKEVASVSFQLAAFGSFTTSSIQLSLLQTQKLAWRTRIISSRDSRTYPGPFIVVDVSRESEDGLSIIVSPLIRIHNETRFSMELRFRRPQQEDGVASVMLKPGDTIDDSMAMFDSLHLSGGLKKALTSLSLGNFLFSFRPNITEEFMNSKSSLSVEWSHDLTGGKAVRLSGIFDKLSYKVRKAFFTESEKCYFSSAHCSLKSEDSHIADMHFLIQSIGRNVPVVQPNNSKEGYRNSTSPMALQEQKEIFLLPTVNVSNLLQSEIHVVLSEMDPCSSLDCDNTENQAKLPSGSSVDFYVSPSVIYFTVTLTAFNSSCKPVNSSDWVKKLKKQKSEVHYLDIDLDFACGNYFASLRLSRGHKGILEATVFTSYALKNDTDLSLYIFSPNRKPLARHEIEFGSDILPEFGLLLPPKSTRSWFLKLNKVCLKLLQDNASEALLDLDALSGLTEISLETAESIGVRSVTKLGVSMGPLHSKVNVPSQLITMVPRYIIVNESEESISVRQCYLQDDTAGIILINSRQRTTLQLWNVMSNKREFSLIEKFIRKHRKDNDDALIYIQFRANQPDSGWSGPVCIASLGRFFLKFREQRSGQGTSLGKSKTTFAAVHVVEEGSTIVLHYHRPPNISLPYRIENCLPDVSITYYQKDSSEAEVLGSESTVDYVWDDLTLPRKLVIKISDSPVLREINLDKVRGWKPFYKLGLHRGLAYHFLLDKKSENNMPNFGELNSMEMVKVGYEVYTDGPTRILRFCEISKSHKGETVFQACEKIQLRVPQFAIHLLEQGKQDGKEEESSVFTPIIAARFGNFSMDSLFTDQRKYNQTNLQSLILEQKWVGAPFAAMLRRHRVDNTEANDCILRIVFVLLSTSSDVIQVEYSSIALQPVDLNLDEETLMKIVPFWRTSLSDSSSKSRQYYFDHFEIQPIKIIANFLPGESYSSYSSAQETLRSLLHSVIKVPPIKNMVVELNGVLVTHALITMRELFIRCAQHYSWYSMRAIYIAKGSPLLPPDFVSIFDDLASSSLDVFFDPSRGLMNLPGFTLGTFKFISKCVGGKGFSGTKRYFGDLGKSLRTAGSNVLFAAVTEISDSVLKGAEANGFNGMVTGFHQGILKLAMETSLLGSALMEGGPDRKIKLDRSPGVDELYIEGYLQAMLDTLYRQEYLRVRVVDDQVYLKNLPPNNTLIEEIMDHVKGFLVGKALLKGGPSRTSHPLRHLRGESEWRLGPTLLTLCEHLFVSFAIRTLRKQANKFITGIKWKKDFDGENQRAVTLANNPEEEQKVQFIWRWGVGRFVLSGIVAYVDGRLCRCIPNPVARRIVSGFLLTFLDKSSDE